MPHDACMAAHCAEHIRRTQERVAARRQGGHVALKYALRSARVAPACIALSTWLEPDSEPVRAAPAPLAAPAPRTARLRRRLALAARAYTLRTRVPASRPASAVPESCLRRSRRRPCRAPRGGAAAWRWRGSQAARRARLVLAASGALRLPGIARPQALARRLGGSDTPYGCAALRRSLDARACRCPQPTWTRATSWATAPRTRSSPASCPTPASPSC